MPGQDGTGPQGTGPCGRSGSDCRRKKYDKEKDRGKDVKMGKKR